MSGLVYPSDFDCGWLAVDSKNMVGIFITAGVGPIPVDAMRIKGVAVEEVESYVLQLPKVCKATLLVTVPDPSSYIELAARGIYVYDWLDVHETSQNSIGAYTAVAIPSKPMQLLAFPPEIEVIARAAQFKDGEFMRMQKVDVGTMFDCLSVST